MKNWCKIDVNSVRSSHQSIFTRCIYGKKKIEAAIFYWYRMQKGYFYSIVFLSCLRFVFHNVFFRMLEIYVKNNYE